MKNVLITGGSGGIGTAMCVGFAQAGYNVAIHFNTKKEQAERLAKVLSESYNVEAFAVQADVADRESVNLMFDEIQTRFNTLDALVNNAGTAQQKLFTDLTVQDWHRMTGVNLDGVFNCAQEAVKRFMLPIHSGVILNISSMWGQAGASCEVHYSAAKAGVIGFTKCLARIAAPKGVLCNAVAPGIVKTDILSEEHEQASQANIPLGRTAVPDEIASVILFLCSSMSSYVTGMVIDVNGGSYM